MSPFGPRGPNSPYSPFIPIFSLLPGVPFYLGYLALLVVLHNLFSILNGGPLSTLSLSSPFIPLLPGEPIGLAYLVSLISNITFWSHSTKPTLKSWFTFHIFIIRNTQCTCSALWSLIPTHWAWATLQSLFSTIILWSCNHY